VADPRLPLSGLTVLNLRAAEEAPALTRRLTALGARVVEHPVICFAPPTSWQAFDQAAHHVAARKSNPNTWVIFASRTAVGAALERLDALEVGGQVLAQARLAAVGPGTAQALANHGLKVELVPEESQAEPLLAALTAWGAAHPGQPHTAWLPRAEDGRRVVEEGLAQAGWQVWATPAYRTAPVAGGLAPATAQALLAGEIHWVLFTSPSTVNGLWTMAPPEVRQRLLSGQVKAACLGKITAAQAEERGMAPALVARQQNLDGLVQDLARLIQPFGI